MPRQAAAPAIVWFRQDLRLADNPALCAAINAGQPLILLYILDDETPGAWRSGAASRWWLHHSLAALGEDIARRGGRLILRRGPADTAINELVNETGATTVFWNRLYEPFAIARDTKIKAALESRGLQVQTFNSALLAEPWTVKTGDDTPFRVFTPYWKAASAKLSHATLMPAPRSLTTPVTPPRSDSLVSWHLLPTRPNWAQGFSDWCPGEDGARGRLDAFLERSLQDYANGRDRPDRENTSRLSPHLHWGEISPRAVYQAVQAHVEAHARSESDAQKFFSELGWREFAHHLLFHFPHIAERNYRPSFDAFPWRDDDALLAAWSKGQTGYPIVDAGMRELWTTGWMHNRVRMIAASFLIKDLLIPWQRGARWFWDTLVDADLANNSASWQWVAGSGADAAPYFRIFSPVVQGEKFDPKGDYVRRWIPEIAKLDTRLIHRPWEAPARALSDAGIKLGDTYPHPIVDHAKARQRALDAFASISRSAA